VAARVHNLATALWQAVTSGRPRALRNVYAADSPAAALHRLYGCAGPQLAIGMPLEALPDAVAISQTDVRDGGGMSTGIVRTDQGDDYRFGMHWRSASRNLTVAEVLPCLLSEDGRLQLTYWWRFGQAREAASGDARLGPDELAGLDPVVRLLVAVGPDLYGVPVLARAAAMWWRIAGRPPDHPPAILAAAVLRLVCLRSGGKGLFREVVDAFGVDETPLRRADAQLRKLLVPDAGQPW